MTIVAACATCGTDRPTNRNGPWPWCCSIACYRSFHDIDAPGDKPFAVAKILDQEVVTDEREQRADAGALDPAPGPLSASVRQR